MKKYINEEMARKITVYALALILAFGFYLLFSKFSIIWKAIKKLLSVLLPFILGIAVAFILYRPEQWMEEKFMKIFPKLKEGKICVISSIIVFLLTVIVLGLLVYIMVPTIISSLQLLVGNIGDYVNTMYSWVIRIAKSLKLSSDDIGQVITDLDLTTRLTTYITNMIPKLANYSYTFISGIFNFVLSMVAGLYILIEHDHLVSIIKKISYAFFDPDVTEELGSWFIDVNDIFQQYIVGTLIDALIIGTVTYIFMVILDMPYSPLIGIIIGVTNLIPMFGPFLGAIPVAFVLILIDPINCLEFLIFIVILQQIDGNVIKPIILGGQLGISGFWILFSVTVGGGLFGIIGMFLGVPVFAVVYTTFKRVVDKQLYQRNFEVFQDD